ncbi:MAG: signal peptidase I [Planctomycetota bacterium]
MPDPQPDDQPDTTERSAEAQPVPAAAPTHPRPKGKRKKGKKPKKKYDSIVAYLWGEWIRPLGIIFVIMGVFRLVAFDWFDVPSGSMEPTILIGDRIAVHKWTYGLRVPFSKDTWIARWGEPRRGDIVVSYSPQQNDQVRLVKRIVAAPGDTIEMVEGRLIINGNPSEYAPADAKWSDPLNPVEAAESEFFIETVHPDGNGPGNEHPVMFDRTPNDNAIRSFPETTVPEGQYVMIGDNRYRSRDSRNWNLPESELGLDIGFIGVERIHGRAFAVAFSLDKKNAYLPRWNRFFKPLD